MKLQRDFAATAIRRTWPIGLLALALLLTLAALVALLPLPPGVEAQSAPGTPSSVTLSRADGTVTASWPAVSGATKYHVTYSADGGGSWHAPVSNHTNITANSLTFDADNGKSYIVGVRAGNDNDQWSGWRNSLSAGPYQPEPTPAPQPPSAVASVTVTRADGKLTASWPAVSTATHYHVTYTVNGSGNWSLAALNHTSSSIDIGGVDNAKTYVVGVRAGNADGWSGWVNSPAIGPYTPPQPTPTPTPTTTPTPEPTPTPAPQPTPPATPAGLTATAADQSVALAWNDPANSSITGYEYQYRYAGVAWSAWTDVADSDADTTSHTVTGLTNGTEYRFKVRAVNAAGSGAAAPNAAPWYVAATPVAPEPPTPPTSITVTRADGAITASWPAVSGATGYTITYSAVGNGNWTTAASNQARNSITIAGLNNDYTYLVGASASNAAGQSASSVSPAAGPYSNKAPLPPPSVTILRADGELTAFWNSGYGAESYHVTYTSDNGKSWSLAAERLPVGNGATEITIKNLDNAKHYTVGVRARNKNGYSGWRNSSPSGPYVPIAAPPKPKNVSAYSGNASAVFIWEKPGGFKGDGKVTGYQAAYWVIPTNGDCVGPAAIKWYNILGSDGDTVYYTIPGLTNGVKYGVALRALNQHVPGPGVGFCLTPYAKASPPPFVPPAPKSLNLIRLDGTLTVTWHHAATALGYQVDYSTNGGQSWMMAAWWNNTTSTTLHGMDNNPTYTVRVRGRNNRGDGPWSDSMTAQPPSVSNLGQTKTSSSMVGRSGTTVRRQAAGFTTGSNSSGYTLQSVTVKIENIAGSPTGLTAAIHSASGGDPASTATHTLTGTSPTAAGNVTYSCASTCSLDKDTEYFLVLSATVPSSGTHNYHTELTNYDTETNTPADAGWSIANVVKFSQNGGNWIDSVLSSTLQFKVTAAPKVRAYLTASGITDTTATLNITNPYGTWWRQWWYQRATPSGDTTCHSVAAGLNAAGLSSLTGSTSYTYKAYDASGCNSADEITSVTFTTAPTPGSRDSSKDFDTLSAAGNTGPRGIWSDGTTMWVTDTGDTKLYAYTLATKARDAGKDISLADINLPANDVHYGLGSDGTTMWTEESAANDKLSAYSISGKSRDTNKDITLATDNRDTRALWANSATIWVADLTDTYIYAYTIATGARDSGKEFDLHADNAQPIGMWSDGVTMWVTDVQDRKLYAYQLSDGSRDSAKDYTLNSANGNAFGIWSDGTTMWVVDNSDDKIYAYHSIQ